MRTLITLLLCSMMAVVIPACKAKRCASFENQDKDFKIKYDRHGRVKR